MTAVSVSLVTYNGLRWLPGCLASLAAQSHPVAELLVVDNGSTDGTAAWLAEHLPADARAAYEAWPGNRGYAAGHNHNLDRAGGDVVLLLNQDIELDPGFVAAAVAVLEREPTVGAVQGRIRRLAPDGTRLDVLDTTGLSIGRDRRVVSRDQGRTDGEGTAVVAGRVWGVDGPAPVIRARALADARLPRTHGAGAEILDESFFAYKEDVDLAWRLGRLGWRAWYEPAALAWHARGDSGSASGSWREIARQRRDVPAAVRARSWRNHRLMLLKNEEPRAFLRDLPAIAWHEVRSLGYAAVADRAVIRAIPGLVRATPGALRKRRALARRIERLRTREPWRTEDPSRTSARVPHQ